jgi:8-oxo-dGTP pyrophosphatase MutT (NUDIX family)
MYTRKKICKFYDICNNCGKQGHTFKQCKNPITSFGVIIFRINPLLKQREYLMIRRKDTLGYIDFMRGKYSTQNPKYLLNMFRQMTRTEKSRILTLTFDELWMDLWGGSSEVPKSVPPYYDSFRQEELNSREKFTYLSTTPVTDRAAVPPPGLPVPTILQSIIYESQTEATGCPVWEEPEWGFPKGRRNYQERDYECALREMSEETGYAVTDVKNIKNILPFEEYFMGSNYKSYKHKYYLMYMDYEQSMLRFTRKPVETVATTTDPSANVMRHMGSCEGLDRMREVAKLPSTDGMMREIAELPYASRPDMSEVSSIEWKTYEKCIECIRPYNLEKKRLITNIEDALNRYKITM